MKLKRLITITILFLSVSASAQNLYRFGQYNFTKSIFNPAALGADASITADLVYRNQWRGIDGAPQTAAINGSCDLNPSMAVGMNFFNDRMGLNQTNSFLAMYSYRLLFDERKYLAFGLGLGGDNYTWSLNDATTETPNDPAFQGSYSAFGFQSSFGVYFRTHHYYLGFSIPQFFQNTTRSSRFVSDQLHYNFIGGYYFEVTDDLIIQPSAQFKIVPNAPIQVDLQVRGIYQFMGLSLGYCTENTLFTGLDIILKERVRIGYMYNFDLGELSGVRGGSGEIYLGMGLPYYFNKTQGSKYMGKSGKYNRNYRRAAQKQRIR